MGFFNMFTSKSKKEQPMQDNNLPAPPSIEDSNLPEISKNSNITRFPTIPRSQNAKNIQKIYEKQRRLSNHRDTVETIQPLFIRGSEFQDIVTDIHETKIALKRVEVYTHHYSDINNHKEKQFEELRKNIENIQHKLIYMDRTLFK